ncbi:hypothetical protein ACLB1S_15305 [Escherichia coli]
MGFKCFRTSIPGTQSFRKVTNRSRMKRVYNFTDDLFDECLKQGMEPVVTLFHILRCLIIW